MLDGAATGKYRTAIEKQLPHARDIKRADLAAAMLAAVDNPAMVHKVVTIAR